MAEEEGLIIDDEQLNKGLIQSICDLDLSKNDLSHLSKEVIDFYENTSNYNLSLKVKWNPFFKGVGILVKLIFSKRIKQLNEPINTPKDSEDLSSNIIQLFDLDTNQLKRTFWLRTFKSNGQVVYSGVYGISETPKGKKCIKAVFPLPNGNATVILLPSLGKRGELILDSSGKKIGDSGFYFLLEDSAGQIWTRFVKSFKDKLVVKSENGKISAKQTLHLWGLKVLSFDYEIVRHR